MILIGIKYFPLLYLFSSPYGIDILNHIFCVQLLDSSPFLFWMRYFFNLLLFFFLNFFVLLFEFLRLIEIICFVLIALFFAFGTSLYFRTILKRIVRGISFPFRTASFGFAKFFCWVILLEFYHVVINGFASCTFGAHYLYK